VGCKPEEEKMTTLRHTIELAVAHLQEALKHANDLDNVRSELLKSQSRIGDLRDEISQLEERRGHLLSGNETLRQQADAIRAEKQQERRTLQEFIDNSNAKKRELDANYLATKTARDIAAKELDDMRAGR
jgi:chromosome segregation ATPase